MRKDESFLLVHNEHKGKELMKGGWMEYYRLFPDYKIEVNRIMQDGNVFLLCGTASGSFHGRKEKGGSFDIPAAWKAIVENGKVKLWQVFADTHVQFAAMGRSPKDDAPGRTSSITADEVVAPSIGSTRLTVKRRRSSKRRGTPESYSPYLNCRNFGQGDRVARVFGEARAHSRYRLA